MQPISLRTVFTLVVAGPLLFACQGSTGGMDAMGPAKVGNTAAGTVLTDASGMTLYVHKDDPKGQSACFGRCARSWPPFAAKPGDRANGKFSIIERKDGVRQWAYDGRALYGWKDDRKPGDATGDNRGGVWFVARP